MNQYLKLYFTGAKVQWRYLCLGHLSLLPLISYLYLPFQIHIINTTWFVMHLIKQYNILWCFANILKLHTNCIVILTTVSAQSFLYKFLLKKVSVSSLMGVMTLWNIKESILVVSTFLFHKAHLASTVVDPVFNSELLILGGKDSTRCWKYSCSIFIHSDMIALHSCNLSLHHILLLGIGLRPTNWGHLSTVNSLSCSRNQFNARFELSFNCHGRN